MIIEESSGSRRCTTWNCKESKAFCGADCDWKISISIYTQVTTNVL